jgi:hypothetical protein
MAVNEAKSDAQSSSGWPFVIICVLVIGALVAYEMGDFSKDDTPVTAAKAPVRGAPIRKAKTLKKVEASAKAGAAQKLKPTAKSSAADLKKSAEKQPEYSQDPAAYELPKKKAEMKTSAKAGKRDLQIKKAGKTLDIEKALATKNQRADLGFKTGEVLKSGFTALGFDYLGDFNYVVQPPDIPREKLPRQIPEKVFAFNDKKVELRGFMLPIEVEEDGHVKIFFLMRDLASCCFGGYPKMNEWVLINVPKEFPVQYTAYSPIAVTGTISIGEKIEYGRVTSIYRLKSVSVTKLKEGS